MTKACVLWVVLGSVYAGPVQAAGKPAIHEVRKGDSLWALAKRHGCTVEQLRRQNRGRDLLRIGTRLVIPACGAKPKAGGGTASSPRYVVRKGDTVSEIAAAHRTTVAAIRTLNRLGRDSLIVVGQTLVLPGARARAVGTPRSVGKPHRGRLVHGVQLPRDPAYYRRRPSKAYGVQHTIDHTQAAIAAVRRAVPSARRVAIGDISARNGGALSGHRSHQSGRDVDIGLYFKRRPAGYPKQFVKASAGRIDLAANWALIDALAATVRKSGGAQYVFLDYGVQKKLYKYAQGKGVSKAKLGKIFQYPHGRRSRRGLVRHEPHHADHMHVRFRCAPKDAKCK
ncbi:MAG: penicillin-insensitive murein endopeptidase [Myxococcota bacterium]